MTRQSWEGILGEEVTLEGFMTEPLQKNEEGAKAVVGSLRTTSGLALEGKILLTLPFVPPWERGDHLRFATRPRKAHRYKNPGAFDYRRFLERRGILVTGFIKNRESAEVILKGTPFLGPIDRLRNGITSTFYKNLPQNEAGFLSTLIVGERSAVSDQVWDDFQKTGTSHLLSISGQHIGIVGIFFYTLILWILKRSERLMLLFSVRRIAGILTLVPIFFYTLLAGSPAPAVRASLLAVFIALAPFVRREVDRVSALAGGALLITLLDPSALFSISFQLSFLAVSGLLVFGQDLRKEAPSFYRRFIITPLWLGLGAFLFTFPLVAYRFHQISFSGLITNLWAIPCVSFILILASMALLIHGLIPALSRFALAGVGWLSHGFLDALHISAILSSKFLLVFSVYPTELEFLGICAVVGLLVLIKLKPHSWPYCLCGIGLIGLLWTTSFLPLFRDKNLKIIFLDVGQGDSSLVVTPSGKALLIDAGGFLIPGQARPRFDVGAEVVVPFLKRYGLGKIDRVLLSHPHPDHYGGMTAVLESLPVGEFWWNGQTFPDDTFDQLQRTLSEKKIPQRVLRQGEAWDWEGIHLEVLYPHEIDYHRNINDNSLVLRLGFGEASLLLTGDIEKKGEAALDLLSQVRSLKTTLVKIPHHASKTSSSVAFIDDVAPQIAVASLGEDNSFGFPHPGVLEKYERRGVRVFRTDQDGCVTLTVPPTFPKRSISIQTFSSGESP